MPTITAPYVETQQVVTGFMYQLHIAAEDDGFGISRLDIGPYRFSGVPPLVKYPEAVTNEMCPPGWESIRWVTDDSGTSWLRWEGHLDHTDGEQIFQMTSNYPPTTTGGNIYVFRGNGGKPEKYSVAVPDYSKAPPQINSRRDVVGQGTIFQNGPGCAPTMALGAALVIVAIRCLLS
ncbi:MAG: hypothetical protein ACLQVD_04990 [Capsulimonadaceae bacterium]